MTTTTGLTPAHLLSQAYQMLVPSRLWTKERWLAISDDSDPKSPVYTMCSVGALLFAEHLAAGSELFRTWDDEVDDVVVDSDWDKFYDEDEAGEAAGSQVEVLFDTDETFGAAVRYLADAVRAEGFDAQETGITDVTYVVRWNDDDETGLDDVQRVFQAAIDLAEAAD